MYKRQDIPYDKNLFVVLAQNGYLTNQKFLAYLRYLQYWHRPDYALHIQYFSTR